MLQAVDFSLEPLPKDAYKRRHRQLTEKLVVLQQEARRAGVGLVVLFEGWNGAGKGSRISDLMYHLDARATSVHVTENLDVAAARAFAGKDHGVTGYFPFMQEFWRALGPRGNITFYDRGWYTAAMQQVLYNLFGALSLPKGPRKPDALFDGLDKWQVQAVRRHVDSIAAFERQLVDDGYVVVKFFVHMTKKGQKKRLTRLHDDPVTRWRVSEEKLARIGNYEEAYAVYDRLLEASDFAFAPWTLLNGEDKRRANIAVAETLVNAIESALGGGFAAEDGPAPAATPATGAAVAPGNAAATSASAVPGHAAARMGAVAGGVAAAAPAPDASVASGGAAQSGAAAASAAQAPASSRFPLAACRPRLDEIDHSLTLDEQAYHQQLKSLQKRLNALENLMYQQRIPLMVMYEGWDAAGKGGNIKRVAQALDARAYTVYPSPAPTKPELLHPHLWRYWTRLPKAGHVGLYDRSWYGRVLVERVEGFATPAQWSRAYDEINEFERDLVEWGAILIKFWVEVSPEEQLRRFREREADPAKQWKITEEDWRNREKRPQYLEAVDDMFRLTSTEFAPWAVLESDDKRYARVKALEIIVAALEARLREA